jgi:hypothetical protein
MKSLFRKFFLMMVLQMGVLYGVPMRPEEIATLLSQITLPKIAHALPEETDRDEGKESE